MKNTGKRIPSPELIRNKKAPLKKLPPDKTRMKYKNAESGRPTVRTPEARKRILEALELGASFRNAAAYAGINEETLTLWRRDDAQFFVSCEEARAKLCIAMLAYNRRSVANGSIQATHWALERFFPEDYGKQVVEVSGPNGGPIAVSDIQQAGEIARKIRENPAAYAEHIALISGQDNSEIESGGIRTDNDTSGERTMEARKVSRPHKRRAPKRVSGKNTKTRH